MTTHKKIAVIGAGAWGTALAIALSRQADQEVRLLGYRSEQMQQMARERQNSAYLPGITFADNLKVYSTLTDGLEGIKDFLIAVPSFAFREQIKALKPFLKEDSRLIWATKGLDPKTSQLLSDVVKEEISANIPLAVLSGPSFAKEVAQNMPTAVTIASTDKQWSKDLVDYFHYENFRVYLSDDLIGVQLGGAIKNVLAIACGISDGMGFGANARCALITRGLAEMIRLGLAKGAKEHTFTGLSGLGDLILTSTDDQSRNRRFGLALGRGMSPQAAKETINQVVEGQRNAEEVSHLAKELSINMPITEKVYEIVSNKVSPAEAVADLFSRPVVFE